MTHTKTRNIDALTVTVREAAKALSAQAVERLAAHPDAVISALTMTASTLATEQPTRQETEIIGGKPPVLADGNDIDRRLAAHTRTRREHGLLGSDEFAARVGLKTRQSVHNWLEKGRIIGWEGTRRGHVFPAAQLDERGKPLPGIDRVASLFPDGYAAWVWLTTPLLALGRTRPLDLLKQGEVEAVIAAARGDAQGDFA